MGAKERVSRGGMDAAGRSLLNSIGIQIVWATAGWSPRHPCRGAGGIYGVVLQHTIACVPVPRL
jgi:hypothetical protein